MVDLIGYRRFGHNETDEPAYTQPLMYERIRATRRCASSTPTSSSARATVGAEDAEAIATAAYQAVADAHEELKRSIGAPPETGEHELDRTMSREPRTTLPEDTLRTLNEQLLRVPEGFEVHRKLRPLPRAAPRRASRRAAGSTGRTPRRSHSPRCSRSGVPVRLTGQDTERGTFSQRHAVLHDPNTGERWCSLQELRDAVAPFELHNSPLSEQACMGFEYGYSVQAPDALVLWEAQFGDFVNSAQVIVDQFLVSGPRQVGPDIAAQPAPAARLRGLRARSTRAPGSSASCRRAAEGNIRVANCTTPAQYFHLLRRQALVQAAAADRDDAEEPPAAAEATSTVAELAEGGFERVIDDPRFAAGGGPRAGDQARALLGQGLLRHRRARGARGGRAHRRGPGRAALPVPRGGAHGADGELPQPGARGVGAGGAAQHGRAGVHAPADGGHPPRAARLRLRRAPAARGSRRGVLGRPQARAVPGSSGWRSTSRATGSSPTPAPAGRSSGPAGASALEGEPVFRHLTIEQHGDVALLRIDRPPANALDLELLEEGARAHDELAAASPGAVGDHRTRRLLLGGGGPEARPHPRRGGAAAAWSPGSTGCSPAGTPSPDP